jgi:nitroreductase
METLTNIHTRRSIRQFQPRSIEADKLRLILAAAMAAPSALDQQSSHFVVCTSPVRLQAMPTAHRHCGCISGAAAGILICHDQSREKLADFWVQDLSASTQNLLLAAHDLGLGAVWIGVYPTPSNVQGLRKFFELPDSMIPFSLVALGYPGETLPPRNLFDAARVQWSD